MAAVMVIVLVQVPGFLATYVETRERLAPPGSAPRMLAWAAGARQTPLTTSTNLAFVAAPDPALP